MASTIFPPRPLDAKNEEGFGFFVSKQAISEARQSEAGGEDCDKFRVEITKPYMKSLLPCEEPSCSQDMFCYFAIRDFSAISNIDFYHIPVLDQTSLKD